MYITNNRTELVLSLYKKLIHMKVITDLGCMDGATLDGISSAVNSKITCYGVDYSIPPKLTNSNNFTFIKCDLNLDLDKIKNIIKESDLILILDVLEHLHDPEIFLEKIGKVMKKNAQILISIPNASSARKLIAWLKNDFPRDDIGYFDRTHRSWFTTKSIKKIFPKEFMLNQLVIYTLRKLFLNCYKKLYRQGLLHNSM